MMLRGLKTRAFTSTNPLKKHHSSPLKHYSSPLKKYNSPLKKRSLLCTKKTRQIMRFYSEKINKPKSKEEEKEDEIAIDRVGLGFLVKEWRNNFTTRYLRQDIVSGTTLAFVALPLALAIAVASHVPPVVGLISAIVGGATCAMLGGTTLGVTAPAAAVSIMTSGIIMKFGVNGIVIVAICAGLLQILTGFFRLGSLVSFIPVPVIEGFIAAIGGMMAITQFPAATGIVIQKSPEDTIPHIVNLIIAQLGNINYNAAMLTGLTMSFIMLLPKILPWMTAASYPLAIATCTILNYVFDLNTKVLGAISTSISLPTIDISLGLLQELAIPIILMYGFVSLESLLSALAVDKLLKERHKTLPLPKEFTKPHNSNQELVGQGFSNIVVGLIGGIPVTGVIIRSSTNVLIGGHTRKSTLIMTGTLAVAVFGVSSILSYIPIASLAGILMATAYKMIHPRHFKRVYSVQPLELLPMIVTFVGILLTDLTVGFELGVVSQLIVWLIQGAPRLKYTIEESNPKILVKLNGAINFVSKRKIENILKELSKISIGERAIEVDFSGVTGIDISGAERMDHFFTALSLLSPSFSIIGSSDKIKSVILKVVPSFEKKFL